MNVNLHRAPEWLRWMQEEHIPEVLATGCFVGARMLRMLDPVHDEDSITYSIQYEATDYNSYAQYRDQHAPALQAKHQMRFEGDFVAFRTLLERVEEARAEG